MGEVKDQGIKKQEQHERKGRLASVSKSLPKADEHHHGQGYGEVNVGGVVEFNVQIFGVKIPERGPHITKSSQAHYKILRGMPGNKIERLAPLFLHVGNFSEAHEFSEFFIVYGRMSHDIDPACGVTVIADPNFEPEIIAQRNGPVKRAVIAHLPGEQGDKQAERHERGGLEPSSPISPQRIERPAGKKREYGEERCVR